jgi:hypothetical protein
MEWIMASWVFPGNEVVNSSGGNISVFREYIGFPVFPLRGNLAEKRQKVGVRKSHFVFGSFELANSSFESPFPA